MPKTNAKLQDVHLAAQAVTAKLVAMQDGRDELNGLLKTASAAKTFADFDKKNKEMFLAVKKLQGQSGELKDLVGTLKSELTGLDALLLAKGKSTTYKMQLAASKSKASSFLGVVQAAKDFRAMCVQDEQTAAGYATAYASQNLGEKYYDLREAVKKADKKADFPTVLSKHVKPVLDLLKADHKQPASKAVADNAKRLAADSELSDDE